MSTVVRLIADVVWSDEEPIFPVLLIFALLGLFGSLWAAFDGIEITPF